MTDDQTMAATPHAELIAELMNPNNPKNDREHAAVREIERLQEALAQEQEPWRYRIWNDDAGKWELTDDCSWPAEPLYTHPPQPEHNYKKSLEAWLDKTEWVQETVKPHELGMHRADVLKQRIEEASPQRTEQEPVAWRAPNWGHGDDEWVYRDFDDPVMGFDGWRSPNNEPLYTHPPQSTWVDLTEKEV